MARSVLITTEEGSAKIVVDGNNISDVLSYTLSEDCNGAVLELRIAIKGSVAVRRL